MPTSVWSYRHGEGKVHIEYRDAHGEAVALARERAREENITDIMVLVHGKLFAIVKGDYVAFCGMCEDREKEWDNDPGILNQASESGPGPGFSLGAHSYTKRWQNNPDEEFEVIVTEDNLPEERESDSLPYQRKAVVYEQFPVEPYRDMRRSATNVGMGRNLQFSTNAGVDCRNVDGELVSIHEAVGLLVESSEIRPPDHARSESNRGSGPPFEASPVGSRSPLVPETV